MNFTKMQGLGNDYIYVDCFKEKVYNPSELAVKVSDRHFGIGGDGLILILPSQKADARMRMFNADGSESPMCGNGIRCVGKYLFDHQLVSGNIITIDTLAGIKQLTVVSGNQKVSLVKVDMGEPEFNPQLIPINLSKERIIAEPIEVNGHKYLFTGISMGNPHCIIFVPEINEAMINQDGPAIEVHSYFPNRTNVEFITVNSRENITMRVWERGSGETLACGTGACAASVAAIINNYTDHTVSVKLRGGDLKVDWDQQSNHVLMTGPAVEVFTGEWPD